MTDQETMAKLLKQGSKELGISLSWEQIELLMEYSALVLDWNEKTNLTSIVEGKEFVIKHLMDSLTGTPFIGEQGKMVDIGSGAGFPGIPLKIFYPRLEVWLVESVKKKTEFLETAVEALGIDGVRVVWGRAEEMGQDPDFRETFDFAVARAVSKLAVIAEYSLPLLKVQGVFLAYKGDKAEEELLPGETAIATLGGTVDAVCKVKLPFSGDERTLIKVVKQEPTSDKYPRRTGIPAKRPLK